MNLYGKQCERETCKIQGAKTFLLISGHFSKVCKISDISYRSAQLTGISLEVIGDLKPLPKTTLPPRKHNVQINL